MTLSQDALTGSTRPENPPEQTDWVIDTLELSKVFKRSQGLFGTQTSDFTAVDRVTMRLAKGEIVGLVGPNGAGKTTLIRMLSTMVIPSSGSARIAGYDVVQDERIVRGLVGVVSSNERSFYWRLTGRENLRFFSDLYHIPEAEARPWREELIELLGLSAIADYRFDHYSTGQKQRMAMARGLLTRPKILLMDEPTKGVDPVGAAEIVAMIQERILPLWHPTILVTSHNLSEIERLCGRVALMHCGRIVAFGPIEQLRNEISQADQYLLTVRGLSQAVLEEQVANTGLSPAQYIRPSNDSNDSFELRVSIAPNSDGFSQLVRAIVSKGGDLLACHSPQVSFDEVFHVLVAQANRRSEETHYAG